MRKRRSLLGFRRRDIALTRLYSNTERSKHEILLRSIVDRPELEINY
jgi:hypothetical protein